MDDDELGIPIWGWVLIGLGAVALLLLFIGWLREPVYFPMDKKVFVITGGSSGIGKAAAAYILRNGGNVALWARRAAVLESARAELLSSRRDGSEQKVTIHTVDVCKESSCVAGAAAVLEEHGAVDGVICSAGTSEPCEFSRQDEGTFERVFRINVLGVRNAIRALLPALRRAGLSSREGARVCAVSSTIGFMGMYGYSAYAASKFALTGLMQSLQQEFRPWNIRGTVFLPATTDTPLLAEENKQKPALTAKIEGNSAIISAEDMGDECVRALQRGQFLAQQDLLTWLISSQGAGMSPSPTMREFLSQTFIGPLAHVIGVIFHIFADMDIDGEAEKLRDEETRFEQGFQATLDSDEHDTASDKSKSE